MVRLYTTVILVQECPLALPVRFAGYAVLLSAAALTCATPLVAANATFAAPVVSVVVAVPRDLVALAIVSGTLVPRDEVLVAPELDGVRVAQVLAEEGDRVVKGQVLARLSRDMLDVQVTQNAASLARSQAAIEQARSQIDQSAATAEEERLSLERAQALRRSGNATEVTLEQRTSASRSANGRLAASRNGLAMAEADLALIRAQRAELDLRSARTEVKAPIEGIISRRSARVGMTASTSGEPLFRLIAHGIVELEGDVTETGLGVLKEGAPALIDVGGDATVRGKVRVVYPEIDRTTRLGKVRVSLDPDPALRIGAFARGTLEVARRHGLAVPVSALLYDEDGGASVLAVVDGRVAERKVRTGLATAAFVEIADGLRAGEIVVARAGSFLQPGDAVRTVPNAPTTASARL